MGVRAKLYLEAITERAWATEVTLRVVTKQSADGEVPDWSAATPTGELKLNIKNRAAVEQFIGKVGDEFFVDITPVE